MKTELYIVTIVLFIFTLSVCPTLAATIHVPADQPTIQAAIDAADHWDLILVAPGTYVENIDFLGKAITLQSEVGRNLTVIDGGQADSVVTFDSGEMFSTVLDGFTIRNGVAEHGGGIYCYDFSSPTIMNCTISENSAASSGGGIYCEDSTATITSFTISGNTAVHLGGGITCYSVSSYYYCCSPTILYCTISYNSAERVGGLASFNAYTTLRNCKISLNYGRGMNCEFSSAEIMNCSFENNGSGIRFSFAHATVINCTASNNSGTGISCDQFSGTITNCTISDNGGSGIRCSYSSPEITNCMISGNTA